LNLKNSQFIEQFFLDLKNVINAISKEDIDQIIEILFDAWKNDKQVFVMGNGGSASTATHFAADLAKTTMVKGKKRFRAFALTDNVPLMSAWINDYGFDMLFQGQLENMLNKGDVLVGFSVHGGKPNVSSNLNKAYDYATRRKAKTIGFAGFDGGYMKKKCTATIVVPANSTPLVEAMHVVLHHLIIFRLKEKIAAYR